MKNHPLLQFFRYEHLPPHLQAVSAPFCMLAEHLCATLDMNSESVTALRKLLESKDCAVRAIIFKQPVTQNSAPLTMVESTADATGHYEMPEKHDFLKVKTQYNDE